MRYKDLTQGWVIEFRTIQDEQLQYHKSPVYTKLMELNKRLKELDSDPSVIKAEVYETRYFDKTL